jgi:hypothetical protein
MVVIISIEKSFGFSIAYEIEEADHLSYFSFEDS